MAASHPFLDWPGPIPFAHRGGGALHPENTMRAFRHAATIGYRYLETDVRVSADGAVVVFHDATLDRVTDGRGRLAELPWRAIRAARVAGTEEIPLLEHLLEELPDARLNIDVKEARVLEPLLETLRRFAAFDRVCLGSFSDRRLRTVRRLLGPGVCTSAGPGAISVQRLRSLGVTGPRLSAHCLQVPAAQGLLPLTDARFLRAARRDGLPVHVWTIDDPTEMDGLLARGVDGIMTDRPDLLKQVLERAGLWVT